MNHAAALALVCSRLSRASLAARHALSLGAIVMAPAGLAIARKNDRALDADSRGPLS
jgi:hypothetical protein